jgi:hypothetical protein
MNRFLKPAAAVGGSAGLVSLFAGTLLVAGVLGAPAALAVKTANSYDLQITLTHASDPVIVGQSAVYTIWLQSQMDSATATGSDQVTVTMFIPGGSQFLSDTGSTAGFTCSVQFQPSATASGDEQCTGTPDILPCQTRSFTIDVAYGLQDIGHQTPDAGVTVTPARDNTAFIGTDSIDSTYVMPAASRTPASPAPQPNTPPSPLSGCRK